MFTNLEQSLHEDEVPLLEDLKAQLQEISNSKIEGIAVWFKIRWINQGEKVNTSFSIFENINFFDTRFSEK